MKFNTKKLIRIVPLLLLVLLVGTVVSYADTEPTTYQVTVENLTGGQPLTPPLLVTHRQPVSLFEVGEAASFELQQIAENGNPGPMLGALGENKYVYASETGSAPVLPNHGTATVEIDAARGAKYLTYVSMLICTNDGFTALDSVRLPKKVGDSMTFYSNSYDAGTEINTEDYDDLVPPCDGQGQATASNPSLFEDGVIHHHEGIQGGAHLSSADHDWVDPVAKITVTRID